jgi:hypothetical protein
MQVKSSGDKQEQIDELPELETRIVPPWVLSVCTNGEKSNDRKKDDWYPLSS